MWKVGDVEPVSVLGVDGYPYGFDLTTQEDKPLVSFAYTTRERAEEAAARVRSAIEQAVAVNLTYSDLEYRARWTLGCCASTTLSHFSRGTETRASILAWAARTFRFAPGLGEPQWAKPWSCSHVGPRS
jgi:hypothetical protein